LLCVFGVTVLARGDAAGEFPGDAPPLLRLEAGVLVPDEPLKPGAERATGLQRRFPPPLVPAENPTTPARAALGRLLFFDPVLSGDNQVSCAHCHHPDRGFADGLPRARGRGASGAGSARRGGVELPRHTPSLWNTLYNHRQFWDGRAADLEEQAAGPITDPQEMAEDPAVLVAEVKAIAEYRELFRVAFGGADGESVSFENLRRAIAAFERTLVSFDSRFDRYAAGDAAALAASELRGLKLFLSTKTRCSECHGLPSFANRDFKVIGVPDPKDGPPDVRHHAAQEGRGGGPKGAFKVPSLRNVALTAPYMHNGVFRTLEEVLDFYAGGGGRGRGLDVPLQDDKVRKFSLSAGEKADLIAFLGALTDTSALRPPPARVPSGFPVVPPLPRAESSAVAVDRGRGPLSTSAAGDGSAATVEVRPGESIQGAVERAGRGGRVLVHPGVYHESVLVAAHGVTLAGIEVGGERPVLDGRGVEADAVLALGDRFTLEGVGIRRYAGNGALAHGSRGVAFRGLTVSDPGLYGVYPVDCEDVVVERCRVSGARDAGIYVGQSRRIVVRDNEAFANVAGIEVENSTGALVEGNHVHGNTGGILVFLLPFNLAKEAADARVLRNRVFANNAANFADPGAMVANVLRGTGILVLAADRTEVSGNEVRGNHSYGIAVSGLVGLYPPATRFDVDPHPDENWVHGNTLVENGTSPDPRLVALGIPGRDLIWDGTGRGNRWREEQATSHPDGLGTEAK
jgi:parallel beta-helix repeat protein